MQEITPSRTLWFEVEDGLASRGRHLHGIPRVCAEIYRAALDGSIENVKFCRISQYGGSIRVVPAETIRVVFGLSTSVPSRHSRLHGCVADARNFLVRKAQHLADYMLSFRRSSFSQAVRPGDILLTIGASWNTEGYEQRLAATKETHQLTVAVLVHDVIPLMDEDPSKHYPKFRRWFESMLNVADCIFAPSQFTKAEIGKCVLRRSSLRVPPVEVVRFGSSFGHLHEQNDPGCNPFCPEPFVLMVGTVSAPHKNQRLLVSIWKRLVEKHGAQRIPALALVGQRFNRNADDLVAVLQSTNFLDGKVVWFRNLGDADLQRLYKRCSFTAFLSLVEGWGLPVDESLAAGKFCVASNRASLMEVGGDLVDYVDPQDEQQAFEAIERLIFDPSYLAARAAAIRQRYQPRSWSNCLHRMVEIAMRAAESKQANRFL